MSAASSMYRLFIVWSVSFAVLGDGELHAFAVFCHCAACHVHAFFLESFGNGLVRKRGVGVFLLNQASDGHHGLALGDGFAVGADEFRAEEVLEGIGAVFRLYVFGVDGS